MKNLNRALRRHHEKRLKNKVKSYRNYSIAENPKLIGKCFTAPAGCSCWLCGNRRKHHGLTLQEQKSESEPNYEELTLQDTII
jgi:hypothetical protein